jgi:hypothetical protein
MTAASTAKTPNEKSRELQEDEKFDKCWLQVDENEIYQGRPDDLGQRVPSVTYNFYKCLGLVLVGQSPCECVLSRTVTVSQGELVGLYSGEFSSLSQCTMPIVDTVSMISVPFVVLSNNMLVGGTS